MVCGLALLFSVAAPAQAAALTSAQVQAIVGLLQSFGADGSIVANVQATLTGQSGVYMPPITATAPSTNPSQIVSTPPADACPQISRTLSQGAEGSDVRDLQEYLGVSQTGYFGPITARAVASFQGSEGLAQVGIVGPQTRAAFAKRCGWDANNSLNFSAAPTSGTAPLSVTFTSNTAGTINFGDGTSGEQSCLQLQSYPSQTRCTSGHTYASAGTYTATLTSVGACSSGMCAQISSVTVTVTPQTGGLDPNPNVTLSASPTSGWAPLEVKFTFTSSGSDSYSINFGDGQTGGPLVGPSCNPDGGCLSTRSAYHTYTTNGVYTAQLIKSTAGGCGSNVTDSSCLGVPASIQVVGTVTITVMTGWL